MKKTDLVGRTIVDIDWGWFETGEGRQRTTQPRLTLDNGRKLYFTVRETEVGAYGVEIGITNRVRGRKA